MQAIITKVLPTTNTKPTRIKAICSRGSVTVSRDAYNTLDDAHRGAAQALCDKFIAEDEKLYGPHRNPWAQPRQTGSLPDGSQAHTFADCYRAA